MGHESSVDANAPPDIIALLRRAQAGDREVRGALCEKYESLVFAAFLRKGAPYHEAFDLTQEALLHADRGWRTIDLDQPVRLAAWMRTIAANVYRKHLKRKPRTTHAFGTGGADDDEFPRFPEPGIKETDCVEAAEVNQALWDCVSKLPIELRRVVLEVFVEGRSGREVGRGFKMPEATVRERTRAAYPLLRECLERKGVTIG